MKLTLPIAQNWPVENERCGLLSPTYLVGSESFQLPYLTPVKEQSQGQLYISQPICPKATYAVSK